MDAPENTLWEGGRYRLYIEFPWEYPFKAPRVLFRTKIYHINVSVDGIISSNILYREWSPILIISRVLNEIYSLFENPNPYNSINCEAYKLQRSD